MPRLRALIKIQDEAPKQPWVGSSRRGLPGAPGILAILVAWSAVANGGRGSAGPIPSAPAQGQVHLVVSEQIGGSMGAMTTRGDVLYVGSGPRLLALSVPPGAAPRLMGRSPVLDGLVTDVTLRGQRAFVTTWARGPSTDGSATLYILDVTDPAVPKVLGHWLTAGRRPQVAAVGRSACVSVGTGSAGRAYVLDVNDASRPRVVFEDAMGTPSDLTAVNGVCVALDRTATPTQRGEWRLLAIQAGSRPSMAVAAAIGEADAGGGESAGALTNDGGRLFAFTAAQTGALHVLDATDPTHPKPVGSVDGIPVDMAIPHAVAFARDHVYLRSGGGAAAEAAIQVVDVTDPSRPSLRDALPVPGEHDLRPAALAAEEGRLYWGGAAVTGFDLAKPDSPAAASEWRGVWWATDVAVTDQRAIVADASGAVAILDPAVAATEPMAVLPNASGAPLQDVVRLAVDGGRAYSHPVGGAIQVADIADSAQPRHLGSPAGWTAVAATAAGDRLYVTGNQSTDQGGGTVVAGLGFDILDMTNPVAPRPGGTLATKDAHADLALASVTAWLAGEAVALRGVDVSRPESPVEIGRWEGSGPARALALTGQHAYVVHTRRADGSGEEGLSVIDLTAPGQPRRLSFLALDAPSAVAVAGATAWVATAAPSGARLVAVDLADPTAPKAVATAPLPAPAHHLVAVEDRVWVPAGEGGLMILALSTDDGRHRAYLPLARRDR